MDEDFRDLPRKKARQARKKLGLPASYDVGVLASVLTPLRAKLEEAFNVSISEAVVTAPHLLALYLDDMHDVAEYVGIKDVRPMRVWCDWVWECIAAYAGYGFGLCEHWRDRELCNGENKAMGRMHVMMVHYTGNALTVSVPVVSDAAAAFEPRERHTERFDLGREARDEVPYKGDEAEYWAAVRNTLLNTWTWLDSPMPDRIIMLGDDVDEEFIGFVKKTVMDRWGSVPRLYSHLAETAAALGAAELHRRVLPGNLDWPKW
jgi:hypothetical protein